MLSSTMDTYLLIRWQIDWNKIDVKLKMDHISDNIVSSIIHIHDEIFDTNMRSFSLDWKHEAIRWLNKFKSESISIMRMMAEAAYFRASNATNFSELQEGQGRFADFVDLRKRTKYVDNDNALVSTNSLDLSNI